MTAPANTAELKRLAEVATPGPWKAAGGYLTVRDPEGGSFSNTIYHLYEMGQKGPTLPYQAVPFAKASDAAFIAGANPETVLSLISTIERQAEEIAALREGLRPLADHYVCYLADTPPFTVLPITVEYRAVKTAFNLSHAKTKEET